MCEQEYENDWNLTTAFFEQSRVLSTDSDITAEKRCSAIRQYSSSLFKEIKENKHHI